MAKQGKTSDSGRATKRRTDSHDALVRMLNDPAERAMLLGDLTDDERRALLDLLAVGFIDRNATEDIPVRDAKGNVRAVLVPLVRYSPLDPVQIKADHERSKSSGPALTLQAIREANNVRARR